MEIRPGHDTSELSTGAARAGAGMGAHVRAGASAVDAASLRIVPMLADLADADLAWIAARSERLALEAGEILVNPGDPAEWMYLGLEGVVEVRREQLGPNAPAYVVRAGDIGGTVPFSRMTVISGTGRAVTRTVLARFPRALFPELLRRIPVLESRFVGYLIDRVRDATRRDAQFEKLTALGKLSAGLAHELNNPVAAVLRTLDDGRTRLDERGEITAALVASGVSPDCIRRLDGLRRAAFAASHTTSARDLAGAERAAEAALERSDREDALAVWLRDEVGVAAPWSSAAVFIDCGIDREALHDALRDVPEPARATAVRWVETGVAAQSLFTQADAATRRIAQLLDSLRTYTNRDRMRQMVDVDIREGIESALTLFDARARDKGVALERALDPVPRIRAFPGDLNQVWASLLDNAIDAAPVRSGKVTVRTRSSDGSVVAEIRDNGPGIPEELHERVFEPFFTTKDVGTGTGLGLDIARRVVVDLHGGQLTLTSAPGDTCFAVRLPLTTVGTFGA